MSIPQTNFENNNRMSELTKNINDICGYVLLYSVIIFTTLSAVFGGVVVYPIYTVICIFNKIKAICCTNAVEASEAQNEIPAEIEPDEIEPDKKPIIDENWCNVSVKNIINFESEVSSEAESEVSSEAESEVSSEASSEAESEAESNAEDEVEEVLSIRRPSEEELKQFQKEEEEDEEEEAEASASEAEADDYSPKDKYSIGHYKSKTHIKDPLDFDN